MAERWYEAARIPATADLSGLDRWLAKQGVPHQITLEGPDQVIRVADESLIGQVHEIASNWTAETNQAFQEDDQPAPTVRIRFPRAYATLAILAGCFAGFALVSMRSDLVNQLLFYYWGDIFRIPASADPWISIREGQWWRLITPIFLHYGLVHILFNALWFGYLGARVESVYGSFWLVALVFLLGAVSNIAQALVSVPISFGGISGVVYGLFSFVWLTGILTRDPRFALPPALFPLISILMLISWTGVFDMVAGGEVADTAHTVGYLAGLSFALPAKFLKRRMIR